MLPKLLLMLLASYVFFNAAAHPEMYQKSTSEDEEPDTLMAPATDSADTGSPRGIDPITLATLCLLTASILAGAAYLWNRKHKQNKLQQQRSSFPGPVQHGVSPEAADSGVLPRDDVRQEDFAKKKNPRPVALPIIPESGIRLGELQRHGHDTEPHHHAPAKGAAAAATPVAGKGPVAGERRLSGPTSSIPSDVVERKQSINKAPGIEEQLQSIPKPPATKPGSQNVSKEPAAGANKVMVAV